MSDIPSERDLTDFLGRVAATPRGGSSAVGRLIFAMDATASREATWDQAAQIQSSMFLESHALGALEAQLCFYRGFHEIAWSGWCRESGALLKSMTAVSCAAGLTQIERVLMHAVDESSRRRVNALVFVGDCVEEPLDRLAEPAGRLGLLGVPAFVFQEGGDPAAERAFREIARLTGGAWSPFDSSSPERLRDLLSAVAVYAVGGLPALERFARGRGGAVLRLVDQMARKGG